METKIGKPAQGGSGTWEKNLCALKARPQGPDLLPEQPARPPQLHKVRLLTAGEYPSLQVMGQEGRRVTLHSSRRALAEAEELAQAAPIGKSRFIVALGLGLGYHLLALLPLLGEEQHLILVENEPEILWAALSTSDLSPFLAHPRTALVVSSEPRQAARHLQQHFAPRNGNGLSFWGHPPSLRAHRAYYQEVVSHFKPLREPASRALGLKKDKLKVLLINPDYFLIPEVMRGFQQLGHEVRLTRFHKRRDQGDAVLRRVFTDIRNFSPDLVFTVNHLGFDREGVLLEALHRLRVPSVSWYVDSPAIILSLYDGPKSDLAFIFVWDPTYIPEVRSLGFERVFPLPLATDPEIFSPPRARETHQQAVAFVGNSMMGAVRQKLARLRTARIFRFFFNDYEALSRLDLSAAWKPSYKMKAWRRTPWFRVLAGKD
uniref:Glycosyltransferase Maf N-terminal domain-containing protein n=1 Tax=Desulfobacca acetoxidans TaxID=60893 RepID=A0A7C3UWX1_9BACT